jgi:hypothetical protein
VNNNDDQHGQRNNNRSLHFGERPGGSLSWWSPNKFFGNGNYIGNLLEHLSSPKEYVFDVGKNDEY